jgi:hypothetical protein
MSSIIDQCRTEPGAPNLDAQFPEDLREFANHVRTIGGASSILFPPELGPNRKTFAQTRNATKLLGRYAAIKAVAMDLRAGGNVDRASQLERECEGIYRRLPHWARW